MIGVPQSVRQQVEQLLRDGHSNTEVQRRTGVNRHTVARYREQLGLPGYFTTADSAACRHGHPFPENLARDGRGYINCRECRRLHSADQSRRRYQPAEPDEAAIERAVAGDPPERLTPRERRAAIVRLDRQQMSSAVIARRVRCSRRTVHRVRKAVAL
ncbi:helix-turn-helix domain-containing protein [Streptomyces sp. NPDC059696]|uniref:helix-turn-helix domain-containing protein n=1 Tax=Streptomyces sp. NPDC059696 TaxID=3346911 RepID=UPI0036BDD1B6